MKKSSKVLWPSSTNGGLASTLHVTSIHSEVPLNTKNNNNQSFLQVFCDTLIFTPTLKFDPHQEVFLDKSLEIKKSY